MCLSHTFNILIFGRILQGIYRLKMTLNKPTVITIQWLLQQNRTRCVSRSIRTVRCTGLSFWYHTDFLSRAIFCPDRTVKNTPEAKFFPVLVNTQQVIHPSVFSTSDRKVYNSVVNISGAKTSFIY